MSLSRKNERERIGRWRTKSPNLWDWEKIRPRLIRLGPGDFWGWASLGPLMLLWLAFLIDAYLWIARETGDFSSKLNFASHLWLYVSAGGVAAALAARESPGILKYPPMA
jgi:hypothetical protein